MPVLLQPKDFDAWLDPEALRPTAEGAPRERTVSKRVNRTSAGDDDSMLVLQTDAA